MVIIGTSYKNFDEYLSLLSKPAKKNFVYVRKHNQDLVYEMIPYDRDLIEKFMLLWERQLVYGNPIRWCFTYKFVEDLAASGKLLCFRARKGDETIAVHFIQKRIGFWECHPPMYEKSEENEKRYLAKYMWFSLINYHIEHKLGPLDMGGGIDNWHETLRRREEFPNLNYKLQYVPEEVKAHPEKERPYIMTTYGAEKMLDYDYRALIRGKQFKFLLDAIRMRLRLRLFGPGFQKRRNMTRYLGGTVKWSDSEAKNLFASEGVFDDGWTAKKVKIDFLNNDHEYVRLLAEFPAWCGKPHTFVKGKINGKSFVKKKIRPGQVEFQVGPLNKQQINHISLSLEQEFKMPLPDDRSCYLRIIEINASEAR